MIELDISGIGVWSPMFTNWGEFTEGIHSGQWQAESKLHPSMIPPRERRRAPLSVKLAVEVMEQAFTMAGMDPADACVVFSSAMGDMDITDYLCETLSSPPRLVSPTRFHNSVHNAATGYWSISAQCTAATNAVSAFGYTASMALIEAAIQVKEERQATLLVMQEMAAPTALQASCPSSNAFSCSLLLTPKGMCTNALARLQIDNAVGVVDWPARPVGMDNAFAGNPAARILPLISLISERQLDRQSLTTSENDKALNFPMSANTYLKVFPQII